MNKNLIGFYDKTRKINLKILKTVKSEYLENHYTYVLKNPYILGKNEYWSSWDLFNKSRFEEVYE